MDLKVVHISFPNDPGATAKQQQTHPKVMTKMVKKWSTDQRFIRKRNTTYKIHTLEVHTTWTVKCILNLILSTLLISRFY